MKKLKLRHNTLMRLNTAVALLLAVPGLLFLLSWIFVEARWAWIVPAVWEAAMLYGIAFGWRHIVVRRATCSSSLLPESFDGYRVLQFSDLHIGTFYRNPGFIRKLVNMINAERPDMIVFTGDMVNVSASEVIPFMKDLAKIKAPDGVFSIMGNHDYCEYGEDKSEHNIKKNQNVLRHLEEKFGWKLLMNENTLITHPNHPLDHIAILGVENISKPPFPNYGNLDQALDGLPRGMFKILLSHDPSHWRRGVLHQTDIALTLSGHTHAGQIRIGRFSPARWAYNEWGGKYTEGSSMLHVSLGLGGTVPFRLGAWPELNVITLKKA